MTVKCLTEQQKIEIAFSYDVYNLSSEELSNKFDRSVRTIQRVLVEQGVNQVRVRRTKDVDITKPEQPASNPTELPITMIEPPQQHFMIRLMQFVKRALSFPFK